MIAHQSATCIGKNRKNAMSSGWCFFAGVDESEEYVNDPARIRLRRQHHDANYDPEIVPPPKRKTVRGVFIRCSHGSVPAWTETPS
ncbi:MAG: DUF2185 domain-containing protein [Bryobacterales bacterium]|nr:DUF2185 domain-containing protein [Bryobacterales bacterium]